jgi:hypothetical protein
MQFLSLTGIDRDQRASKALPAARPVLGAAFNEIWKGRV